MLSFLIDKIIYVAPAILVAMSLHEFAHGWASYMLGDPTPKAQGRLSINPLQHLDATGALLLFLVGFGWAKPVQVDSRYYENPKADMVKVALAGPIMNFFVAFISLLLIGFMEKIEVPYNTITVYVANLLYCIASINIGLGVFNLIPIPPLDGSKVLFSVLPAKSYFGYMRYEQMGMIVLLLFICLGAFNGFLITARDSIISGMLEIVSKIFSLA